MEKVITKYFDYGLEEMEYLKRVDATLGEAMTRLGKVERVMIPDLFTALIYAIVSQLISAKAVHTIWNRMQEQLGEISPSNIALQSADDIQACGMTMRKAVSIQQIAHRIATGSFHLEELHDLSDAEVIQKLMTLNGVGKWTAEMMLINSLERPNVVSWGDVAIRRGMMKLYGLNSISKEEFEQYCLRYSPYGSIASIYLWNISIE